MTSKSHVLNLFDAIDGSKHYFQKVSSDKVDIECDTLPLQFKSSSVSFVNLVGDQVSDIVGTVLGQAASIAQEVSDRTAAVSGEESARISADNTLQSNINAEASARASAVSSEASARAAADTILQNNIDAEAAARAGAVTAELTARSNADSTLQFNIDAEATARANADIVLQAAITQEVSDRQSAIASLSSGSSDAIALVQTNLDAEAATRLANDNTLQANITAEVAARAAAVSAEASARAAADETLSTAINAEQAARLAEVAVERGRIDALLDGTSIDLNQLQELVTAYTTSDSNILSQIATITTNFTNIQAQLNSLESVVTTLVTDTDPTPPIFIKTTSGYHIAYAIDGSDGTIESQSSLSPGQKYYYRIFSNGFLGMSSKGTADLGNATYQYRVNYADWNDPAKFPDGPRDCPEPVHFFTNVNGLNTMPGGVPGYDGSGPHDVEQSSLPDGEYYYRFAGTQSVNMVLKSLSDAGTATAADVHQTTFAIWNDPTKFPYGPRDAVV